MKCGLCGNTDSGEYKELVIAPKNIFKKVLTLGGVKVLLCQTCISKMFRKLDPKI